MKYNLEQEEKQQQLLRRLEMLPSDHLALQMFNEIQHEVFNYEELDYFVVKAIIIIVQKQHHDFHKGSDMWKGMAKYYIRQYSNEERLPIRLTIFQLLA